MSYLNLAQNISKVVHIVYTTSSGSGIHVIKNYLHRYYYLDYRLQFQFHENL